MRSSPPTPGSRPAGAGRSPGRWAVLVFAGVAYLAFARSMLYWIAFLADAFVGKTVDSGSPGPPREAVLVDLALLLAFVVPHSLMAREAFEQWLRRVVGAVLERSVYVLASSLLLVLTIWQWRPLPDPVWEVERGGWALRALSVGGWLLALGASHSLGHLRTFGVAPALAQARGRPPGPSPLVTRGLYGRVRHPMYVGFLIGVWATPRMSWGHLLLAAVLSLYVAAGRLLEERDLERLHGERWRAYRARVPAFLPRVGATAS